MAATFFANQKAFRKWLEKNHNTEAELFVGFYKVNSGKQNMTWSQSVDEALCFGWIDGIRNSIDNESYMIRFTPRKLKSNWSAVNIKKVEELIPKGLMHPSGLALFENRIEEKSKIYTYENGEVAFSPELEKLFKANKTAWDNFQLLAPSYRKAAINWVMSAKQEVTRLKRLNELVLECEAGKNRWKDNKK